MSNQPIDGCPTCQGTAGSAGCPVHGAQAVVMGQNSGSAAESLSVFEHYHYSRPSLPSDLDPMVTAVALQAEREDLRQRLAESEAERRKLVCDRDKLGRKAAQLELREASLKHALNDMKTTLEKVKKERCEFAAELTQLASEMYEEEDVIDGPNGDPQPNAAMRWRNRLKELHHDRERILREHDAEKDRRIAAQAATIAAFETYCRNLGVVPIPSIGAAEYNLHEHDTKLLADFLRVAAQALRGPEDRVFDPILVVEADCLENVEEWKALKGILLRHIGEHDSALTEPLVQALKSARAALYLTQDWGTPPQTLGLKLKATFSEIDAALAPYEKRSTAHGKDCYCPDCNDVRNQVAAASDNRPTAQCPTCDGTRKISEPRHKEGCAAYRNVACPTCAGGEKEQKHDAR